MNFDFLLIIIIAQIYLFSGVLLYRNEFLKNNIKRKNFKKLIMKK